MFFVFTNYVQLFSIGVPPSDFSGKVKCNIRIASNAKKHTPLQVQEAQSTAVHLQNTYTPVREAISTGSMHTFEEQCQKVRTGVPLV